MVNCETFLLNNLLQSIAVVLNQVRAIIGSDLEPFIFTYIQPPNWLSFAKANLTH